MYNSSYPSFPELDDPAFWAEVASQVDTTAILSPTLPSRRATGESWSRPYRALTIYEQPAFPSQGAPRHAVRRRPTRLVLILGMLLVMILGFHIMGNINDTSHVHTVHRTTDHQTTPLASVTVQHLDGLPKSPYVAIAWKAAQVANINPIWFVRQINQESGFNPNALSLAGAEGIAQFMPDTAASLGIDPWNPDASLYGAARFMASQLQQYNGDWYKALAAYNAGGDRVNQAVRTCGDQWLSCMPTETRGYVQAILGR